MALILLHPVGLDAMCWSLTGLTDAVGHEFPGHGGRLPSDGEPFTLGTLADEVAASYPGQLDLVGVSMGGIVAQHVALRHPGRVRSLLLACASPACRREPMLRRADAVAGGSMAPAVEPTLSRWFSENALRTPAHPGVAYARRRLATDDPRVFAACWRALSEHDVRGGLGSISARVTCVAGRQDASVPDRAVMDMSARIRDSRYVEVDGPHLLQLEVPAAFGEAVRAHLAWAGGHDSR
jgi:pimeloyl-ACP methyl ester carboxylesterase